MLYLLSRLPTYLSYPSYRIAFVRAFIVHIAFCKNRAEQSSAEPRKLHFSRSHFLRFHNRRPQFNLREIRAASIGGSMIVFSLERLGGLGSGSYRRYYYRKNYKWMNFCAQDTRWRSISSFISRQPTRNHLLKTTTVFALYYFAMPSRRMYISPPVGRRDRS
ncbi:hypothetical protein F5B18DRAFT_233476 [Nemania serpens]|nr:hypothetical protein F5B18DRAFT_233476 [Nemania serpens]